MAASIDQQFIEYIIKSIVGKPDEVKIERTIDEKGVLLELSVDPEDLGRVIGKRGATAQSLRTLLRALGTKNDARYNLKIVDTGPPPERRGDDHGHRSDDQPVAAPADGQTTTTDDGAPTLDDPAVKPVDPSSTAVDDQTVSDELENEVEGDDVITAEPTEADHSSVIDKTRKELADLDDLDI